MAAVVQRTFEQYLKLCPEDGRYELVNGGLVQILETRQAHNVADFMTEAFNE